MCDLSKSLNCIFSFLFQGTEILVIIDSTLSVCQDDLIGDNMWESVFEAIACITLNGAIYLLVFLQKMKGSWKNEGRGVGWLIVPGTPRVKRQLWICTYMLPSPPVLSSLVMDFFFWQIAIAGYFLDDISTNGKSFSIAWMALKKVIISHLIP